MTMQFYKLADYMLSNKEKKTLRVDSRRIISIAPSLVEFELKGDETVILRFEKHKDNPIRVLVKHVNGNNEVRKCFELNEALTYIQEKGLYEAIEEDMTTCPFFANHVFSEE